MDITREKAFPSINGDEVMSFHAKSDIFDPTSG